LFYFFIFIIVSFFVFLTLDESPGISKITKKRQAEASLMRVIDNQKTLVQQN